MNARGGLDGRTPLFLAALGKRWNVCSWLLEIGASKNIRDELGLQAYEAMTRSSDPEVGATPKNGGVVNANTYRYLVGKVPGMVPHPPALVMVCKDRSVTVAQSRRTRRVDEDDIELFSSRTKKRVYVTTPYCAVTQPPFT